MKLGELVRSTARRFSAARLHYGHGTGSAHDEAAYLVQRALGLPFHSPSTTVISAAGARKVESLVRRRIDERIPVAYLLNEAWLDGLSFYVDRRAIVPRSHIASLLASLGSARMILDLCTGSGCLAILAAKAFPKARVDASDVSADALAVARRNVKRHRLETRVTLLRSDLFAALAGRRYDLVLCNPPYVETRAMRRLPAEYRYEPGIALAGGGDGLDFVSRILAAAPEHLTAGGKLVCEIGEGRRAVERRYPRLPLRWPAREVFVYAPGQKNLG